MTTDAEMDEVPFEALVGIKALDAVDYDQTVISKGYNRGDKTSSIRIRLSDVVYEATENPDDGYRSSMAYFKRLPKHTKMKNVFPAVLVEVSHDTGSNDLLIGIDLITRKEVFRIGTSNTDDYYPSYTDSFDPTAMVINQSHDKPKYGVK